jgi:small-conductance mechanosensitive channel
VGKVSLLLRCAARKEKCYAVDSISDILVVVGVVLWVINSYIPMQSTIKKILNVVVIIVVIVWLLSVFGFIGDLSKIRIGR